MNNQNNVYPKSFSHGVIMVGRIEKTFSIIKFAREGDPVGSLFSNSGRLSSHELCKCMSWILDGSSWYCLMESGWRCNGR